MRRILMVLLFAATACRSSRQPAEGASPGAMLDPGAIGAIAILQVELPAGGVIGGHYEGVQFQRRVSDLTMTEGLRRALMQRARLSADTVLMAHGYSVRASGLPSSDADRLEGVRFGLAATVSDVRVRSEGSTPPVRVNATAEVSWELIDLAAGRPVFGTRQSGAGRAAEAVDAAILEAFDRSLARLLADSAFRVALSAPRPAGLERLHGFETGRRAAIEPGQNVIITAADLNQAESPHALERVAAGTVAISNRRNMVSGFLLTRDGLAVTVGWIARRNARLHARFANGVERPVRLIREAGGFALIEISCPDPCQTVDAVTDGWISERDSLFTISAPWQTGENFYVSHGRGGGRCGLLSGRSRFLGLEDGLEVRGQPVARPDGQVFAVAVRAGKRACAVSIAQVFRDLRIQIQREEAR